MRVSLLLGLLLAATLAAACADAPVALHGGAGTPPAPPTQAWAPTLGAQIRIVTANPVVGQPMTVDGSGSAGPQPIVTYRWSWGDGSPAAARTTARGQVHTYATAATHTIGLTVIDNAGDSASTTAAVTVAATPTRGLTWTPATPAAGQLVTFGLTGDSDPVGNAAAATWQFAQHTGTMSGTGQSGVTVRFDSTGSRRVAVRIAFPGAPAEEHWATVPVGAPAAPTGQPVCPAGVRAGGTVTCTTAGVDPVSGATLTATDWVFDSGVPGTSTAAAPVISYAAAGAHEVRLTATNAYAVSATLRDTVTVVQPDGRVAMGLNHTCARHADGRLYCWGLREYGAVGDGFRPILGVPTAVSGALAADTVVGGANFGCALVSGALWCWGDDTYGAQARGAGSSSMTDVPTPGASGLTFASLAAGGWSTCGIAPAGAAYCWGKGLLGNGTTSSSRTPVLVSGGHTWRSLSRGQDHACGVTTVGDAYCWGSDIKGSLGAGLDTVVNNQVVTPTLVVGGHTWDHVAVGQDHTCGLTTLGTAYCWGGNLYGQLGDSTKLARDVPVPVAGGRTFTRVVTGANHASTCALDAAGAAWCWGLNNNGQLGDQTTTTRLTPTAVKGGHVFRTLSAQAQGVCGVTVTDAGYCWGTGSGRRGDGTDTYTGAATPVAVTGGHAWTTIVAGKEHTCGRTTTGALYCWGGSRFGDRGDGQGGYARVTPVAVDSQPFVSVAAGARSDGTCAVTAAGAAWCWGELLGSVVVIPSAVATPLRFADAVAGGEQSCGVTRDAAAYCWGAAYYGMLGNGTTAPSQTAPSAVAGAHRFLTVTAGWTTGCGIREDLAVLCWGFNGDARLGDGTTTNATTPTLVGGGHRARAIAVGMGHGCLLTVSGEVYCWGDNGSGQLGTGNFTRQPTPVAWGAGRTYTHVAAGQSHTCALTVTGELWCAGQGSGFGDTANRTSPVRAASSQPWTAIFAGGQRTCMTNSAATFYCVGYDGYGAMGPNTSGTVSTPTQPGGAFQLP